jgi:Transposase DDE domain
MTSIFWINSFLKPAHSMSWIAAISTSSAWRTSMMPEASSSPAPSPTSRLARRYSRPVDRSTGLICDQTALLTGFYSRQGFDRPLRRIKFNDPQTGKRLVFLTNNFALDALTIAKLYKYRWQVELFFKWIKQHLRIKAFFGTSENAVKSQIWIAVSVYVLVAIVKKRLALPATLYEILQILSLTLFEKTPVDSLFDDDESQKIPAADANQLNLFN